MQDNCFKRFFEFLIEGTYENSSSDMYITATEKLGG